jgi:hypothetical protein
MDFLSSSTISLVNILATCLCRQADAVLSSCKTSVIHVEGEGLIHFSNYKKTGIFLLRKETADEQWR